MDPDSNPPSRPGRAAPAGLCVVVSDGRGRPVADGGLGRWLAAVAPRTARGELGIALVSDARMRVLNKSYRRQDYATDVLSFEGDGVGDLVIATGVARRQAREAGHSYQTELRVLGLHGLLHLLGYDHEDPDDNGRMQRTETRLRRKGGLTAGLIQREGARVGVGPREQLKKRLRPPRAASLRAAQRQRAGVGPRQQLKKRLRPPRAASLRAAQRQRVGVGPREQLKK